MSEKLDVCYIVTHGFAARMVLQTGLLAKLRQLGYNVGLIVPDATDENLVQNCKAHQIKLIELRHKSSFLEGQINQIRKYFLENIDANPCLYEKHMAKVLDEKRSWFKKLQPNLGYQAYLFMRKRPRLKGYFKRFEERIFASKLVERLLKEIKPRLLIATYPVMAPEPQLLLAA